MKFKITKHEIIPKHFKGAGDVVAMVAEPVKKMLLKHLPESLKGVVRNCNCNKRREKLNELVEFVD